MPTPAAVPPTPILYRTIRAALTPLVRHFLEPTVEGLDNVPSTGPAILCANHLSVIDSVVVPIIMPRDVRYLGKREYFVGPLGWLFEHLGVMPVAREGGTAAEASLRRGGEVLASGALLGVYPEGTRSPDGRLYRGRTGPVRLAMRTGAPIVPIGLAGTRDVMPPRSRLPRPAPVTVRVGRPLWFPRRHSDDRRFVRDATDEVMRRIMTLSGQTYVDAYAPHDGAPGRLASGDRGRVG